MNPSTQVATHWQHLKHTGLVLVLISMLTLLVLLGVVGAGISHLHQGAMPTGGLMAGGDPPVITHHTVAFGIAANNGDIHVGESAEFGLA